MPNLIKAFTWRQARLTIVHCIYTKVNSWCKINVEESEMILQLLILPLCVFLDEAGCSVAGLRPFRDVDVSLFERAATISLHKPKDNRQELQCKHVPQICHRVNLSLGQGQKSVFHIVARHCTCFEERTVELLQQKPQQIGRRRTSTTRTTAVRICQIGS